MQAALTKQINELLLNQRLLKRQNRLLCQENRALKKQAARVGLPPLVMQRAGSSVRLPTPNLATNTPSRLLPQQQRPSPSNTAGPPALQLPAAAAVTQPPTSSTSSSSSSSGS